MFNYLRRLQVARSRTAITDIVRDPARRNTMIGAFAVLLAASTGACSITSAQITAAEADIVNGITSLENVAASFASIVGLPATTLAQITGPNGYLAQLQSFIQAGTNTLTDTTTTTIQKIVSIIEEIVTAVASFASVLPSPLNEIIPALSILLPVIATAFNFLLTSVTTTATSTTSTTTASAVRRFAATPGMSVSRAKLILAAYATK